MSNAAAAHEVMTQLRRRIITTQIAAGTPLREIALAEEFGVSRVPIREALRSLTTEGFVITKANAGSKVAEPPFADAAELFELRINLEVALAGSAAQHCLDTGYSSLHGSENLTGDYALTPELEDAKAAVRDVEAALEEGLAAAKSADAHALAEANFRVHVAIAQLARRPVLSSILVHIGGRVEWMHTALGGFGAQTGMEAWEQHSHILSLVVSGKVQEARDAMREHLVASRDEFLSALAARDRRA